jgi:hypothetical protein
MSLNNVTSSQLRSLIPIVERKERLQEELAEIESKLSIYLSPAPVRRGLRPTRKPGRLRGSKPFEVGGPEPRVQKGKLKPQPLSRELKLGKKRGSLKDLILIALKKAGHQGLGVKELAAALGAKSNRLHVWFSTTGKNVEGLTKVGPGRWTYDEN